MKKQALRWWGVCVMASLMVGCGGGGGSGSGSPAPVPAPPAPMPSPPAPPPAAPAPSQPTLTVDCTHRGSGSEHNVGGPAGSPNRVAAIGDVPWETLGPGDTVRIHWRDQPYAEKLVLFRSGMAQQPLRICGVPGPQGARPALTGAGATTRNAPAFRNVAPTALQPYGLVVVTGPEFNVAVHDLVIENLRLADTKKADGTTPESFSNSNGVKLTYNDSAACIRMRQAHRVTIRSNELANCGDGLFAQSLPDGDASVIRQLLVEGNWIHGNANIGDESRHQAYLQGVDITVQFNVFGPVREVPGTGAASGNQLKMRAAGIVVRHNWFENGARTLDLVEAEEHIAFIAPWQYARLRSQYLGCQQSGCLRLSAAELAQYDQRQQQDWAKYQVALVYGNLFHVWGRDGGQHVVPSQLVHYGFDNTQHDRQPGVLWFFHNTVLFETDRSNLNPVRLFDYGSDFGDGGYYGYPLDLRNVGNELHYLTDAAGKTCQTAGGPCTDWGPMLQTHRQDHFGRMRAFNNAIVLKSFAANAEGSEFEFTRNLWDQLELVGPNWITSGWNVDRNAGDGAGGGYGRRALPAANVYPGGNTSHHVSGVDKLLGGSVVPIDTATFAPSATSPLREAAGLWDARLPTSLRPTVSIRRDPAQPGRLVVVPRTSWNTIGAVE